MSKSNCKTVRAELDEVMLSEECSAEAQVHLSTCHECSEFHEKQIKLRQIVGSLGTVSAPPDFDIRLRSRLARESSVSGLQLNRSGWSFGQRGLVATMSLILLFGAVMMVRYFSTPTPQPETAAKQDVKPTPVQAPTQGGNEQTAILTASDVNNSSEPKSVTIPVKNNRLGLRPRKEPSTLDFSSDRASSVRVGQFVEGDEVFSVDAAQQSLRVSLFDSRGNPRTISVPTVSFGSKRVLPVGTQFAPKGSW